MLQTITIKHTRLHELLDSPMFRRSSPDQDLWKPAFAELIILVNELLIQTDQDGKRVDFREGVGVNGKVQDITSLVAWLRSRLPNTTADFSDLLADTHLNRYFDQGTGYFANGSFFTGEYADDVAFFMDDQRIYLNKHIRQAVDEAEAAWLEWTDKDFIN